ncbi:hypothetical protein HK101_003910 [Irineochytrium annulatum]|nr:hypothetical protein HK101_003910 [Irineochytrium annulatum]
MKVGNDQRVILEVKITQKKTTPPRMSTDGDEEVAADRGSRQDAGNAHAESGPLPDSPARLNKLLGSTKTAVATKKRASKPKRPEDEEATPAEKSDRLTRVSRMERRKREREDHEGISVGDQSGPKRKRLARTNTSSGSKPSRKSADGEKLVKPMKSKEQQSPKSPRAKREYSISKSGPDYIKLRFPHKCLAARLSHPPEVHLVDLLNLLDSSHDPATCPIPDRIIGLAMKAAAGAPKVDGENDGKIHESDVWRPRVPKVVAERLSTAMLRHAPFLTPAQFVECMLFIEAGKQDTKDGVVTVLDEGYEFDDWRTINLGLLQELCRNPPTTKIAKRPKINLSESTIEQLKPKHNETLDQLMDLLERPDGTSPDDNVPDDEESTTPEPALPHSTDNASSTAPTPVKPSTASTTQRTTHDLLDTLIGHAVRTGPLPPHRVRIVLNRQVYIRMDSLRHAIAPQLTAAQFVQLLLVAKEVRGEGNAIGRRRRKDVEALERDGVWRHLHMEYRQRAKMQSCQPLPVPTILRFLLQRHVRAVSHLPSLGPARARYMADLVRAGRESIKSRQAELDVTGPFWIRTRVGRGEARMLRDLMVECGAGVEMEVVIEGLMVMGETGAGGQVGDSGGRLMIEGSNGDGEEEEAAERRREERVANMSMFEAPSDEEEGDVEIGPDGAATHDAAAVANQELGNDSDDDDDLPIALVRAKRRKPAPVDYSNDDDLLIAVVRAKRGKAAAKPSRERADSEEIAATAGEAEQGEEVDVSKPSSARSGQSRKAMDGGPVSFDTSYADFTRPQDDDEESAGRSMPSSRASPNQSTQRRTTGNAFPLFTPSPIAAAAPSPPRPTPRTYGRGAVHMSTPARKGVDVVGLSATPKETTWRVAARRSSPLLIPSPVAAVTARSPRRMSKVGPSTPSRAPEGGDDKDIGTPTVMVNKAPVDEEPGSPPLFSPSSIVSAATTPRPISEMNNARGRLSPIPALNLPSSSPSPVRTQPPKALKRSRSELERGGGSSSSEVWRSRKRRRILEEEEEDETAEAEKADGGDAVDEEVFAAVALVESSMEENDEADMEDEGRVGMTLEKAISVAFTANEQSKAGTPTNTALEGDRNGRAAPPGAERFAGPNETRKVVGENGSDEEKEQPVDERLDAGDDSDDADATQELPPSQASPASPRKAPASPVRSSGRRSPESDIVDMRSSPRRLVEAMRSSPQRSVDAFRLSSPRRVSSPQRGIGNVSPKRQQAEPEASQQLTLASPKSTKRKIHSYVLATSPLRPTHDDPPMSSQAAITTDDEVIEATQIPSRASIIVPITPLATQTHHSSELEVVPCSQNEGSDDIDDDEVFHDAPAGAVTPVEVLPGRWWTPAVAKEDAEEFLECEEGGEDCHVMESEATLLVEPEGVGGLGGTQAREDVDERTVAAGLEATQPVGEGVRRLSVGEVDRSDLEATQPVEDDASSPRSEEEILLVDSGISKDEVLDSAGVRLIASARLPSKGDTIGGEGKMMVVEIGAKSVAESGVGAGNMEMAKETALSPEAEDDATQRMDFEVTGVTKSVFEDEVSPLVVESEGTKKSGDGSATTPPSPNRFKQQAGDQPPLSMLRSVDGGKSKDAVVALSDESDTERNSGDEADSGSRELMSPLPATPATSQVVRSSQTPARFQISPRVSISSQGQPRRPSLLTKVVARKIVARKVSAAKVVTPKVASKRVESKRVSGVPTLEYTKGETKQVKRFLDRARVDQTRIRYQRMGTTGLKESIVGW